MATSSGRFWSGPIGRWLASTKNIVGGAIGVLAVVAHVVFGLGPLWPLVVVAAYGIGALVAPRDRLQLRLGLGAGASAEDLADQLKQLGRASRRLDPDAQAVLGRVLQALDDIVSRWDDLAGAPDQAHTVEAIIVDYLPTSLQRYLDLPRAVRTRGGATGPHGELMDQLGILEGETVRIREAVYSRGIQALGDQGRFLREKFARSDLEL